MQYTTSSVATAAIDQMFRGLQGCLDKAAAHGKSTGVEDSVYTSWRLAPDMFTMARQVQIACDIAVRGLTRLSGAEPPSFPDTETTFAQLKERIAKAHAHIKDLDRAKIDANPDADITVPMRDQAMTMKRHQFLQNFILPNVYFHVTAAYLNLRNAGVPLGKSDFLAR
ncbi:MAG TPA: DUF1993 domain-containing protein [Parvularcula sp.]|nr:DUF1993 domain-containing protein [Parvularcula sp.]HBS36023.1 DUF1993 domain-containing protein [Parvularcula sp.]